MSTGKVVKTKGIVLSEVNFSESDKMLTILTPDLGRITCVAKGARKMQSPILSASQIFAFSELVLFRSKGEMYYINSAELIEAFYALRTDYDKLEAAMFCVKFVKQNVCENQVSVMMLKLLLNSIYLIATGEKPIELVKSVFMLKAICLLGYTPNFSALEEDETKVLGYSMQKGELLYGESFDKSLIHLSYDAMIAIRYVIQSDLKKVFSFQIREDVLNEFAFFNKIYIQAVEVSEV